MDRIHKFRGKRMDNGEWVEGDLIHSRFANEAWINTHNIMSGGHEFIQPTLVDPSTVGEFTGLTDKNGTEICEGDILKSSRTGEVGFVAWHGTMAGFVLNKLPRNRVQSFDWGELFLSYMKREVIGNIHDNPELMGGDGK
jgi:uncharacterized phage protein (TIGR01671 family)